MALVAVVHPRAGARTALTRGVPRGAFRVRACRTVEQAAELMHRELMDAVVIDVRAEAARAAFSLAQRYPGIPVFGYSPFGPDDGVLLTACQASRLAGVLVEGVDDAAAGELIARRTASQTRRTALQDAPRLLRLTEPMQQRAWDEVLSRVSARLRTSEIARALGRTREHVSREFAAGGAPNLKRVIDLACVACAADLLANPGYDVATVARILGFASSSHLSGCSRRVVGVTPRELPKLGLRAVLARFLKGRTRSRV